MATKRTKGPRGPKGEQGRMGPRGPRGYKGAKGSIGKRGPKSATKIDPTVGRLAAQMEAVLKELHVQLTRIGQIQAQLDRFASGRAPGRARRRMGGTIQ